MTSEQHVCAVNTSDIYSTSSKAYPLYSLYQRQRLHAPIDHGTVCCNNQMLLPSGTAVNWILTRRHRPSDSTDRCSDDAGLELVWWSGVVVSTLALINEVNLRRARLVLRWVTVSGSIPGDGHLFQYVTNQPPKANSAFHPSGVGK